ncbi:hypothetical protein Q9R02_11050 [Arthrobacter sp. YJM1]|uniref:DUF559 domain-containing protein n=3 Tax=Arthrobacter TaxID=1663 RepID=A0ABU9KLC1_9MICC|nr:hypothetical protein [Arthrobacter sp. YJM1]MDP5227692.1 hypothetical protein [Arthrobacter sp. YJM1]
MTRGRLRGGDLEKVSRGIRRPLGKELERVLALRGYTDLDDQSVISDVTAASVGGIPLPADVDELIHVSRDSDRPQARRAGVVGHRTVLFPDEVVMLHGLRITSPARTWLDLARTLTLWDLVVAGDHLVNEHGPDHPFPKVPICTVDDLQSVLRRHGKKQGIVKARAALELIRVGADSPRETKARLLLRRHGLPEPELNIVLYDRNGRAVVWPDLGYRNARISIQYDGEVHGEGKKYLRDIEREVRTRELGWEQVRVGSRDLEGRQPRIVQRVEAALRRADALL